MSTLLRAVLVSLCVAGCWPRSMQAADEQAAAFHRGLGAHLLSHCLRHDLWACVALQLHAQHFPTAGRSDDVSAHLEVDAVLLRAAMRYLSTSNSTDTGRGQEDKLLLPLVVAILMKTLGLIPLALGNLTFLGLNSVIASKVSLGLVALLLLKKWLHSDGSLLQQHTYGGLLRYAGLEMSLPHYQQPPLGLPPYHLPPGSLHPQESEPESAIGRRRKIVVVRQRGGRRLRVPALGAGVAVDLPQNGGAAGSPVGSRSALDSVQQLNATDGRNLTKNVPPANG